MPTRDDFRSELQAQIGRAQNQGRPHVEINAGELHRAVGGYPSKGGRSHAMPVCCAAMREEMERVKAEIVYKPACGKGAALTIRYHLPRSKS
jgi:5-methylcytosine-specific restriction protein A